MADPGIYLIKTLNEVKLHTLWLFCNKLEYLENTCIFYMLRSHYLFLNKYLKKTIKEAFIGLDPDFNEKCF